MDVKKININQSEQTYNIASGIYDVSAHNNGAVFESLSVLLGSDNLSTLIPTAVRCGGMTIRFVQSSDNKYVQYRLMTSEWSLTESDWQGVDDEPTAGSDNLVKSSGVCNELDEKLNKRIGKNLFDPSTFVKGKWITVNGIDNVDYGIGMTSLIPISEGETLSIRVWDTGGAHNNLYQCRFGLFNARGEFISGSATEPLSMGTAFGSITGTSVSKYAAFSIRYTPGNNYKVQVEKGNTSTDYEPYTEYLPLREVEEVEDGLKEDIDGIQRNITDIRDIVDKIYTEEISETNYDSSAFSNNGFIERNGIISNTDKTKFKYTDYILIDVTTLKSVEICALFGNDYGGGVAFYNSSNQFISSYYHKNLTAFDNTVCTFTPSDIPNGTSKIRVTSYNDGEVRSAYIKITNYGSKSGIIFDLQDKISDIKTNVRNIVNIYTSDTELEIFNKLMLAFNTKNCDVYWQTGTYTFSEVYTYMKETLGWTGDAEIPIGGNCRYYFNNSTIISNEPQSGLSGMTRNLFGVKRSVQDFEMYDGILINNQGFYVVHDEGSVKTGHYRHVYKNMYMYYYKPSSGLSFQKCIGGGTGQNATIIIENCIFHTDMENNTQDVSWHSNTHYSDEGNSLYGINCDVRWFVNNCWFSKGFSCDGAANPGDSLVLQMAGNSYKDVLGGWTYFGYNNTKRQS